MTQVQERAAVSTAAVSVNGKPAVQPPVRGTSDHTDLYMLDELLTDKQREVRQRVRNFVEADLVPVINPYWERAEFPFPLIPKIAALNIAGFSIQGYGCPGFDQITTGLACMELGRGDLSTSTFTGVQSALAMNSIALCGSEEQKQRWLPAMARLEKIGAFGLNEPYHGTDVVALETSARRDGDSYVLNGHKRWIGNGTFADHVVIWARGEDGHVGGYVVDKGTPGFQAEAIPGKIALRVVQNAQITLDNARIPADHKLAEAHTFRDTERVLLASRFFVAWEALGAAIAGYEAARSYALERRQFGYQIAGYQLVQEKLSGMVADITAMFCMMLRLSQIVEQGKATMAHASLAKMQNCRRARSILREARDILGGNGIVLDYGVARHLCDMEAIYTYEGTDTVQSLIVGREVTGFNAFLPPTHK
jgi:glutaryl-CoA dehydrogenase